MTPLWYTGFTLTLLVQVTFGVNPLDSILSATVEKVLQGVEARLAQQGEVFKQLLVEQTEAMEARLIERIDAQETRLVDNKATMEARFAGQTVEIETRLAQHNRGMEVALESLKARLSSEILLFHRMMNETNSLVRGLEGRVTREVRYITNTAETLLRETRVHLNTTEFLLRETLVHSNTSDSLLRESLVHSNTAESLLRESLDQYNQTTSGLLLDLEEKMVVESRHIAKTTEIRLNDNLALTNDTVGALLQSMEARLTTLYSSRDTHELVSSMNDSLNNHLQILKLLKSRLEVTFLRRVDGSVNFTRNWANYTSGFGDCSENFWLGLETLHQLTTQYEYGLRVDMEDWSGDWKWAEYQSFRVGSETGNYTLTVTGYNPDSTTTGDSMAYHNIMEFSTYDKDNDLADRNCAALRKGGWWFNACTQVTPTGRYETASYKGWNGIRWRHAYNDERSFKSMTLKLTVN